MAKMKKKTRRLLLNLAFVVVLITVTLVVLFVSQKDELNFRDILEYFKNSNPVWIVAAFVCMLFLKCSKVSVSMFFAVFSATRADSFRLCPIRLPIRFIR